MKVFVVEDNGFYAELLSFAILRKANDVHLFSSAKECIDNLGKRPDLIVLDYYLGDVFGTDILHELNKLKMSTKVVLLSASKCEQIENQCINLGAHAFISKGVDSTLELEHQIRLLF